MRESVGSASLFTIVIVLLLLFTGYFCVSINYTSAYKVSDSIINTITKDEGLNLEHITEVLALSKYSSSGQCGEDWTPIKIGHNEIDHTDNVGSYCVKKVHVANNDEGIPDIYYYRVKLFYRIEVPILSILNFNVQVDSSNIYSPTDDVEVVTVEG